VDVYGMDFFALNSQAWKLQKLNRELMHAMTKTNFRDQKK
jgi:hypothetical protein